MSKSDPYLLSQQNLEYNRSHSYGHKHRFYNNSSPAFTIVELLVVIVVIGILAAITIVSYTGISSRATVSSLQSDLTNAVTQLKLDQVTNSMFPSSLAAANGGKGIPPTSGTSYTYAYSNTTTPQTFCITATKNNISYNITQDGNSQPGICPVLNLDAGNISSYPGTGTTWTDLSGNGNSGTLYGGVTYSNTNGGVLSFDGVSGYVSVGNPATIQVAGTNNFSVSAWIYLTSTKCGVYAIDKSNNTLCGSPTNGGWILGGNSGSLGFHVSDSANLKYRYLSFNPLLNTWYHLVGVRNGNTLYLYVNGNLNQTGDVTGFVINDNYNLTIGGNVSAWFLPGRVGNVNIYNKALNSDEVQQNFNVYRSRYGA